MSYQTQAKLEIDYDFQQRNRAVTTQQAGTYINDTRPTFVAVAEGLLRDDPRIWPTFTRLAAAGPGTADKVELPNGEIDSSLVTDADLLSLTQANWQVVAGLYFNEDGTPLGG